MRVENEALRRGPGFGGQTMVRLPSVRLATHRFILSSLAMAIVLGLALAASPAWAEFQIGGYGGWSESFDSDIHLSQPGGTNLTLNDVPWDERVLRSAALLGSYAAPIGSTALRVGASWSTTTTPRSSPTRAPWSASSGTRDGVKLGPKDRVGNTFQVMEFTNGINEIFFGGQYRWMFDRWTPYVGVGVGFAFPHVEVRRAPGRPISPLPTTIRSPASRSKGWSGLNTISPSASRCSAITSSATRTTMPSLKDGGSLQTDVVTNHFIFGVSYRFGGGPAPEAYDPYK